LNIFTYVKAAVTTRQAAIFYGLKVNANGMTCCPFHQDKHPSMKVDERYYCFGCHRTGDVIDFVSHLFGLTPYQAARKLAENFGLRPSPPNAIAACNALPQVSYLLDCLTSADAKERADTANALLQDHTLDKINSVLADYAEDDANMVA